MKVMMVNGSPHPQGNTAMASTVGAGDAATQMELEEIMLRHIVNKNLLSMVTMISLLILQNNLDYILYPVASALAYHSWAFCMFFSTPSPFSYICPKAAMAGAAIMSPRWAAFLYKVNALL